MFNFDSGLVIMQPRMIYDALVENGCITVSIRTMTFLYLSVFQLLVIL